MEFLDAMTNERSPLSEEEINEARRQFHSFLQMMAVAGKKRASATDTSTSSSESRNNDYYMKVTLKNGRETKLKTIFHAIEVSIEDKHGGVFKCSYHMKNTVDSLYKWILDKHPDATVDEIQRMADEEKKSFTEMKKLLAFSIAESEFWIRMKMARFMHEQLQPTLEMVLADLVEDTALYGMSEYGYKLTNPKDLEKDAKAYISLRKKRSNVIEGIGKRKKALISTEEISEFIEKVFASMQELDSAGKKITSHAVARKVIGANHSNPLKAFKDKLKKYGFVFEDMKEDYAKSKK
ncbi:MAG: hypothetical protein QOF02_813 [Blastocatellia bacterium]|jgi:hypothetical protein|nr:hypothetical protein [Blastocatellia bacterium]